MLKNLENCKISRLFSSALNVILRRERSELSGEYRNVISLLLKETNNIAYRFFTPVILGLVPKILAQQVTNLVNKFALLFKRSMLSQDCRNASGNDGCWGREFNTLSQCGRSMIEMLGVLAIIAVLSVGGIAGYSKAMEKWKINKMAEEYSYLIHGLLEHLTEFQNLPDYTGLIDTGLAMGIIPDNWKRVDNLHVNDAFGNKIKPYVRDNKLVIDFYFGGHNSEANTQGFYKKACKVLMRDMAAPLHYSVNNVWIFFGSSSQSKIFFGDSVCKENCLRDISLKDINDACNLCDSRMCGLIMEF